MELNPQHGIDRFAIHYVLETVDTEMRPGKTIYYTHFTNVVESIYFLWRPQPGHYRGSQLWYQSSLCNQKVNFKDQKKSISYDMLKNNEKNLQILGT